VGFKPAALQKFPQLPNFNQQPIFSKNSTKNPLKLLKLHKNGSTFQKILNTGKQNHDEFLKTLKIRF
jgi:hypothetical protein